MVHLTIAVWVFLAHVQSLPIHNHEETPLSVVTKVRGQRQNGTALMGEGLASLVSLLHRESKGEFQHQVVLQNDSQIAAPINSSLTVALIDSSGKPQEERVMQSKSNAVWIKEADGLSPLSVMSDNQEKSMSVSHNKEVQVHAVSTAKADVLTSSSEKEISSSVVSTALVKKQMVRSRSPSLQSDEAPRHVHPQGFFWFHWELLKLAKPGLVIFGILVLAAASMAFLKTKAANQAKENEMEAPAASERLLAVAQRLQHSAEMKNEVATGVCKNRQSASAVSESEVREQAHDHSEQSDSSLVDANSPSNSDAHAIHLMDELGFMVPSVDDLFPPATNARKSPKGSMTQPATSASRLSPEMALSEETRKRREAIVNILRNLPDAKNRDSSGN